MVANKSVSYLSAHVLGKAGGVLNSVDCEDSVVIRETMVYRDTLIPVAVKDSTSKDRTVPTDTARAETDLARAKAWLERDSLKLTISNKPSPIPPVRAKLPEKARTELHTKTITEIKTVEVNHLTKWQKVMISLGYVFIGICAVTVIFLIVQLENSILRRKQSPVCCHMKIISNFVSVIRFG